MNVKIFWELIDTTREASGGNVSGQADLLVEELVKLSENEIISFDTILHDRMDEAYDAVLWDATEIIGCGCVDDGSYEFRGWLIAHGSKVYENALADPESLMDLIEMEDNAQDGAILYTLNPAYKQKTGQELPWGFRKNRKPALLKGIHLTAEDMKKRFPKLAAKFGDCEKRWAKWLGN